MHAQATEKLRPTITYSNLVGQVILLHRRRLKLDQSDVASALGVSQSAYSRLEGGDSSLSVGQLRIVAERLGVLPNELLRQTDELAERATLQGVTVTNEKKADQGPLLLALGILAAILATKK